MRLTNIFASGFRCFHAGAPLDMAVRGGLTLLVGENDSGKTAVVEAIRLALGTRSEDRHRLDTADFSIVGGQPERNLAILATFGELTDDDAARFMEWCTVEGDSLKLHVCLKASLEQFAGQSATRAIYRRRTGPHGNGPPVEGVLREYLAAAYLRPLRDAGRELSAGRRSRLSRILASLPEFSSGWAPGSSDDTNAENSASAERGAEGKNGASSATLSPVVADGSSEGKPDDAEAEPVSTDSGRAALAEKTLVQIIQDTDRAVREHPAVARVQKRVNDDHLAHMSLGDPTLRARLGIGAPDSLSRLLERLELVLDDPSLPGVRRGLGLNNLLFMAAELLLLSQNEEQLPLLLIEEPEAHLHPQLLARVLDMLTKNFGSKGTPQLVLTTHSPLLASSAQLDEVVVMRQGRVFPLEAGRTRLDKSDYVFLRRFLDSTKANLFFARGVVLVEGLSEVLLLPAIARKLGWSFEERGVSLVNVGHVGFFRYARIFQDPTGATYLPVPVACVRDLDLPPKAADGMARKGKAPLAIAADPTDAAVAKKLASIGKHRGGTVEVFPSGIWTLEYDLAEKGLAFELHAAVKLVDVDPEDRATTLEVAKIEFAKLATEFPDSRELAREVFRPILQEKVSKVAVAENLAMLVEQAEASSFEKRVPDYLVRAIKHAGQASTPTATSEPSSGEDS